MRTVLRQIEEEKDNLIRLRRELHRYPELALREYRTAERIEAELDKLGFAHRRIGETGVLGILQGNGGSGSAVALRADIDALPIQELNTFDYRSRTDGVMHACGHDAHTTCLIGAARALARNRDRLGGEVRFFFQPAEETGKGAADFIDAGLLHGVRRVFGLHVAPDLPVGAVGLRPGLNNAGVDHFAIHVQGKSAHVASPQLGVDALYIASQIVVAIQPLITRRTSPTEPEIIGVGMLHSGTTYNALAETAELEGTTRTISAERRKTAREWITRVAEQTAAMYGGSAEVEWTGVCSPLVNDGAVCEEVGSIVEQLFGEGHVVTDRPFSLGGDNFSEYLLRVPGAYAYLGTGNPARPETLHSIHNGHFELDEDALTFGAALYALYALSALDGDN